MEVRSLLLIFSFLLGVSCSQNSVFNKEKAKRELVDFLTPYRSELRDWFWTISGNDVNYPFGEKIGTQAEYITCEICTPLIPLGKALLQAGVNSSVIIDIIVFGCEILDIAPRPEICRPTIESYASPILYIIESRPEMKVADFCGIINPGCGNVSEHLTNWTVDIPPPSNQRKTVVPSPLQSGTTKILRFTDIHLDLDYKVGGNGKCDLPICCREEDGEPAPGDVAGRFGHFGCGLPEDGMNALYENAKKEHADAKLVFVTGDYIHNGIWLYTQAENERHHTTVMTNLKEAFSDLEIFPVVGNHEPYPVNMFPPEEVWGEFPLTWMYDSVTKPLGNFLPPAEMERFRKYGFYSTLTKLDEKLRIVVTNTNICYVNNFWLPYDAADTSGQLKWLAETLLAAEQAGETVFLLGHIYPGSGSCWPVWSNQFQRIIERFHPIIKAQFYGHSHDQDYHLTLNEAGTPISTMFVGGSTLTSGMNSAYHVYTASEEYEITDHQTWVLNITATRETPVFEMIQSTKESFGMEDCSPKSLKGLIDRMVCDDDLFREYQKFQVKGANSQKYNPCKRNDYACKANVVSDLVMSNSMDRRHRNALYNHILNVDCSALTEDPTLSSTTEGSGSNQKFPSVVVLGVVGIFIMYFK